MSGRWLIVATLLLCVSLVLFALWQRSQHTARVREFWGPAGAHLIQHAPNVALRRHVGPQSEGAERPDDFVTSEVMWAQLSSAPGLIHLRATLVDDRYYQWPFRAATVQEQAATSNAYCVLRFEDKDAALALAINIETGTVINMAHASAIELIPSSRQAIAAYLQIAVLRAEETSAQRF